MHELFISILSDVIAGILLHYIIEWLEKKQTNNGNF